MKEYLNTSGRIFDIQRYSIHDGPGIRTIVFLKGCALRCRWCCNPESQSFEVETMMINGKPKVMGKDVTVAEVMKTVERDMPYYLQSNGGITLSGGECTLQHVLLIFYLRDGYIAGTLHGREGPFAYPGIDARSISFQGKSLIVFG